MGHTMLGSMEDREYLRSETSKLGIISVSETWKLGNIPVMKHGN